MGLGLHQVTKTFGPVRALRGVTVSFAEAAVTGVLGGNGAGKSTLLALLGTLAKPSSGRVDHSAVGATVAEVRQRLGWVGHDLLTYGELTGRENIELAAQLRGVSLQTRWAALAARFDLEGFVGRPVRTYSRGQRQRIALARALVADPMLLLLDEPTTGLDPAAVARLGSVVREEAARGAWVVVVTHDVHFARAYCDTTLELERGQVKVPSAA
jgi:heme exporter protein A